MINRIKFISFAILASCQTYAQVPDTLAVADSIVMTVTPTGIIDETPKEHIDTIYYSKDMKVVKNKAFADFYRIALYPADEAMPHFFRTYYMSGELESEGQFLSLHFQDDDFSKFHGKFIRYFKNKRMAEQMEYREGLLHGDYFAYYDNGMVKEHVNYNDGMKDGLHTSFTEDGKVCRITPYKDNLSLGYYAIMDYNGNYSKFNEADDRPVMEKPQTEDMKTEYKGGVAWHYYNKNGLIVGVSNSIQKELGGYREIGIFVVNKSMVNVDLNPDNVQVYDMKKGRRTDFKIVGVDEYDKKILKQKKKIAKRDKHPTKVAVVYEHENNVNANLGAQEFGVGTSNTVKTFQERMVTLKEISGENRYQYAERLPEDLGYLERTTVHPGEIVSGFIYTSSRKTEDLFVNITINGIDYLFEWKTPKR